VNEKSNLERSYSGKRVLVTGHTGFKGSWLTLWLTKMGAQVTGLSDDIPTSPSHYESLMLKDQIRDLRGDIRDLALMKQIVTELKPDYVFHLAAQSLVRKSYEAPLDTFLINSIGTANVLEALRDHQHKCAVVLVTSDKCYENLEWEWGYRETDRLGGKDPYSGSKAAAEIIARSYTASFFSGDMVRIATARAGNVIGGGDWASDRIIPDCVRSWSNNLAVELRSPESTRPWQHVLEPLSGYLSLGASLAASEDLHGESFNFGPPSRQDHSVREVVNEMSKYWDAVNVREDQSVTKIAEAGLLKLNCDKALAHLDWEAVWNFEETIQHTAEWYRHFYTMSEKDTQSVLTISQLLIDKYVQDANQRGIKWAGLADE
jgi:CDP-glucose 4,6-dehydratase